MKMLWLMRLSVLSCILGHVTSQAVLQQRAPVFCDEAVLSCQNDAECYSNYIEMVYACEDEWYDNEYCSEPCLEKVKALMLDSAMASYFTCKCRDDSIHCKKQKCKFIGTCLGGDCGEETGSTEGPEALVFSTAPTQPATPSDVLCDEVTYNCRNTVDCHPLQVDMYSACEKELVELETCSDGCIETVKVLLDHPTMDGFASCRCENSPYCQEQKCTLLGTCLGRECPTDKIELVTKAPNLQNATVTPTHAKLVTLTFNTDIPATSTEANTVVTKENEGPISGRMPEITEPPHNITVAPGGSGQFVCTAEAATTPLITITKKDQTSKPSLESFKKEHGTGLDSQTTINSITINNVGAPNVGWYTCLACNRYGCAEYDAYLHVKDLCEGAVCPGEQECVGNYKNGEGYTCECPQFCGYRELTVNDWVCSNYCEDHFNQCQMKADACENEKFGIEVMNRGRCAAIEHPVILEQEMELGVLSLTEGEYMELECNAIGFPEPEIIWYRDDEVVGNGNIFSKMVQKTDEGSYMCEAVNCMATRVNRTLSLVFVNQATSEPTSTPTSTPTGPGPEDLKVLEVDAPRSTCAVFGDPHFLTFDMKAYTYMGTCDNVLAMDCEMGRWFVYGRMRPCGLSGGSCLETVTAYVDSEVLELQRGWLVNQDGGKIAPKNHKDELMHVVGQRNNFTLQFDGNMLRLTVVLERTEITPGSGTFQLEKLVLLWDGFVSVEIQVPEKTRTCGMCGNNDGKVGNDMRTRRRGITHDPVVFGDSWKIDRRGVCEDVEPPKTAEEVCGARYDEVRVECQRIFDIEHFKECIFLGHDTAIWIESCIYDECEGGMQVESLPPKCMVANAYAIRCSEPYWIRGEDFPRSYQNIVGWEGAAQCPDTDDRYQPVLDTGCPQPSEGEEMAGHF